MRKLVTSTFVTLDGVMQAPGGPQEDTSGGFASGGWTVNYWDDVLGEAMAAATAPQPDMVLGRKTYEILAAYWPTADEPGADDLNNAKKYVASRTLDRVEWNNSTLLKGDMPSEIARLKAQDGPELQVVGSSNLIQTLLRHHLIDELHLLIFPVAVGKGKRLFGEGTDPSGFKLLENQTSTTGLIIATYAYGGELTTGSFV
jgi:dihydrofolate reductase